MKMLPPIRIIKHSKSKLILLRGFFIAYGIFILCVNFSQTCNFFIPRVHQKTPQEPGIEFADLKPILKGVAKVGYLTDKDMSAQKNDGVFLSAQSMLAPTVLDLENAHHRLVLLDCNNLENAMSLMQDHALAFLYVNPYNKILAENKP